MTVHSGPCEGIPLSALTLLDRTLDVGLPLLRPRAPYDWIAALRDQLTRDS
jgi:hypothetical protein